MAGVEDVGAVFERQPVLAKLFRHGGSQAVRLPKAFRFEGEEVAVRKEGNLVILEPVSTVKLKTLDEWEAFWTVVDAYSDVDFPHREQPEPQERDLTW